MEDFLKELGITNKVEETDQGYIVTLEDSNEFAKIYSKLDRSDLIDEVIESSQITPDTISVQYVNDDYTLTLLGDLEGDVYTLTGRIN